MNRSPALLLLAAGALLAAGCPFAGEAGDGEGRPPASPPPSATPARSPAAPARGDDGEAAPPADRAGPPGPPRVPRPEEGRHQLDIARRTTLQVGDVPVEAYVVTTEASRRLGLMHVKELPEDQGMLFVYPRAGRRSFWMRNTFIPLSLAYIAEDGTIDQIVEHMRPLEDTNYPSKTSVRFVLEVNQGWFDRHGVAEGDRVHGLEGLVGYD